MPETIASSMMNWIAGLSTMGSISFGWAFVAGKNRVPSPAAGIIALRIFFTETTPNFQSGVWRLKSGDIARLIFTLHA
jgi:hypothetical protein